MNNDSAMLMHLIQFGDSAFPIGTFSFSNGLETAIEEGIIGNAAELENYVISLCINSARFDSVAALHAWRCHMAGRYDNLKEVDNRVIMCKLNDESRLMTCRMGRKTAELAVLLTDDNMLKSWLKDISAKQTAGTLPVAQAMLFSACGMGQRALFCNQQYGVANMVLGAALRCMRVSHYDTQRILFSVARLADRLYEQTIRLSLDDMSVFMPQTEILASLHEKGHKRIFMN